MNGKRVLIVNADDFGLSRGVNLGVMRAHEEGVVTSASLLVRWPAAAEAAAYSRTQPQLSLGLHFDLAEWTYSAGGWVARYEVVPANDAKAVAEEARRQLAEFRRLVGQDPTHIDSHQHVHRSEPARSALLNMAGELRIPLRQCTPDVQYYGGFYGQTGTGTPLPECISEEALMRILRYLPPGITELGCHPGLANDFDSTYGAERSQEVQVLCAPRIRATLEAEGVELSSFWRVLPQR